MNTHNLMTQARFWNQVQVIPQSNSQQCWEWTGARNPTGYGIASIGTGRTGLAHRFVASLTQNITGQVVMHTCDNPGCVRPDHLVVGSQQNNIDDMVTKGRKNTKLNPTAVRDIRTRRLSRADLAQLYNCSIHTIGEIQRGRTWCWVR